MHDEFLSIKFKNNDQESVLINWKFRENTQKASTPRETHSLGFKEKTVFRFENPGIGFTSNFLNVLNKVISATVSANSLVIIAKPIKY